MATVLRLHGWRVVVYSNDHRPAHVHVLKADVECVFDLVCPNGPPRLRENYGCSLRAIREIYTMLANNLAMLCRQWSVIHGDV